MQKTLEELITEGKKFMELFEPLDERGKISVLSYMRGYNEAQKTQELERVAG